MSRLSYAAYRLKELSFLKPDQSATPQSTERLGQPSKARPKGCLLWLHTSSGGDAGPVVALAQELSRLRQAPVNCLVTTDIETFVVPALEGTVIHQLAPGETAGSITRFLDHWSPDAGIELGLTERPRLIGAALARGVPMFHAAPRREPPGSRRKYPGYLSKFNACLAVSASEAQALRKQFDVPEFKVEITGPLSDTINATACNEAECSTLAELLGGRPVWLAASAPVSEFEMIETAHRRAFRAAHRLLLILVLADLETAAEARQFFEGEGWRTSLRSDGGEPDPDIQVYIANTEDEQGLWYRLAPTSYVGGTLQPGGAPTDPYEPAALGSAVLRGPFHGSAPSRFDKLQAANASMLVSDAGELGEAVLTLLAPDKAATLAQAGWSVTTESAHVVERLAELIDVALGDGETI